MEYHVHTRYSPWHRFRIQALGGLASALFPYLIRLAMVWGDPGLPTSTTDSISVLHLSFFLSVASILVGTLIVRSITRYPGVQGSAPILPAFSVSFGLVLLLVVMGRIDYNRFVLAGSYVLAMAWFYLVYFKEQRRHLRIGLVPTKQSDMELSHLDRVTPVLLCEVGEDNSQVDLIAVDLRLDVPAEWERRLADYALAGVPVFHVKHLEESLTGRVALEHLSEISHSTLSPSYLYLQLKSIGDWLLAVGAAVLLAPVLIAIALAVRFDSPGPAIFRQRRIGYRGKPFVVLKFRTMSNGQAPGKEGAMTRHNDERITRLGRVLRQSRLDELPQIWNILCGQMSWIGPRPEAEVLSRWYENELAFYRYRHIVRPGITGWAQVNQGHVAELEDVNSKLHYDFYYIKNFSPWIDLLIVVRTIRTMLTGFGAK